MLSRLEKTQIKKIIEDDLDGITAKIILRQIHDELIEQRMMLRLEREDVEDSIERVEIIIREVERRIDK